MSLPLVNLYRPRKLSDIVGQSVITQTITNELLSNKLHHVYLFTGHFGSGKTSLARVLAASENCVNSPGINPCGKCENCESILNGKHQDVIEMDAAGEAGKVDQMRELKRQAYMGCVDGAKKKYYIIDEAHSMSSSSAESLLKILEECPLHVRFVLCTTNPKDLTSTIISRCQRFDFKKIHWSNLVDRLKFIAKEEKIECEDDVFLLCARFSDGSMRNAIQHFEKLARFVGKEIITTKHFEEVFSTVSEMAIYDIFDEIIGEKNKKPDATRIYEIFNVLAINSVDSDSLISELELHISKLQIGLTASNAGQFMNLSEKSKYRLSEQLSKIKQQAGLACLPAAHNALLEAKQAIQLGTTLEVAMRKWYLEALFAFRVKNEKTV